MWAAVVQVREEILAECRWVGRRWSPVGEGNHVLEGDMNAYAVLAAAVVEIQG
jgi:hypothetical protein